MKNYFGNYLGLVVNSSDPEYRGRVQVFVPHVMPALYEGWNKEGVDIQISCVGSNIPEGLTPEIHQKLVKILPWAEAASPIIGPSAPGNLFSDMLAGAAAGAATGGVTGALVGAAAAAGNHFYNQQPSGNPVVGPINDAEVTNAAVAAADAQSRPWSAAFISYAAKSADPNFPGASMHTSYANAVKSGQAPGWSSLNPANTQIQPGDIVIKNRAGSSNSFNGSWSGSSHGDIVTSVEGGIIRAVGGNVSDSVTNVRVNPSETFAILRPPPNVAQKMVQTAQQEQQRWSQNGWKEGNSSSWGALNTYWNAAGSSLPGVKSIEKAATSSEPSSPYPLANPSGTTGDPKVPQSTGGMVAGPPGTGTPAGTISGGGTASNIDTSNMSPAFKAQYERVSNSLEGSKFIGTVPKDGATYGIVTGSKEEWAHFFTRNASVESGFNPNTAADINGKKQGQLTSFGLYQMGSAQFQRHGGGNIYNPDDATKSYLNYAEELYFGNTYKSGGQNVIGGQKTEGGWYGLAAGYGPIRRVTTGNPNTNEKQLLAENMSKSEQQTGNYTGTVAETVPLSETPSVVNNTDGYGRTPIMNNNDMASGLFAYPNPGAMVWVFFREGNPLYPVYFAASYSAKEWTSAYRGGSQGTGYYNDGKKISTGTRFSLGPQGGIWSHFDTNLEDTTGTEEKASMMLYHKGGSNLTFDNGIDFYHSHYARRDEVEQDRFIVTKGYKEEWVEGDSSTNVRGDLYVKVGKIDQETMNALQKMADYSSQINAQLTNNGGGGKEAAKPADPSVLKDKSGTPPPLFEIEKTRTEVLQDSIAGTPTRTWLNNSPTGSEPGPTIASSIKQYQKL